MENDLYNYSKYIFVFAHPDDEIYCCCLMRKLISLGKEVKAALVTSGDYAGEGELRERELKGSMKIIGVKPENTHLLKIHEREILNNIKKIVSKLVDIANEFNPDCIVGQDYEGGHNGHDAVSFATQETVKKLGINNFYVFPVYWGNPETRKGARFKPERKDFIAIPCAPDDTELKKGIKKCHASQRNYFKKLEIASADYLDLLYGREVFYKVQEEINFKERPTQDIGYEFSGQFTFEGFHEALEKYYNS